MTLNPAIPDNISNRLDKVFATLEAKGYNINSNWILEHHGEKLLSEIENKATTLNDQELTTWIENRFHEIAKIQTKEFKEGKINGQKIRWYQFRTKRQVQKVLESMTNLPVANNDIEHPIAA